MIVKNISFFFLLFTISHIYGTTFAVSLMIDNTVQTRRPCTGKVAKERQPLFIKAETYEENFTKAHILCLQTNDCEINQLFQEAKHNVEMTIIALTNHLKELETKNDGSCHACEKTEGKDLKNRLTALLDPAAQT
jgi:hypothetical protein